MAIYGVPGDPTYSETLTGLDEIMATLPSQDTGSITARNLRDVSFTLWEEIYGISTWSFSYTSLTPSTVELGGIPKGTTFSYVPLQELLDKYYRNDSLSQDELSKLIKLTSIEYYNLILIENRL